MPDPVHYLAHDRLACGDPHATSASPRLEAVTCTRCLRAVHGAPESDLLRAVRQVASEAGYLFFHVHDSRRSPEGYPDCTLVHPTPGKGEVYMLELKTATSKPTMAQLTWLAALDGKTVHSRLVRPADLAALGTLLGRRP